MTPRLVPLFLALEGWHCACPPQPTPWERFEPIYWLASLAVLAFLAWRAWLFYAPLRRRSR